MFHYITCPMAVGFKFKMRRCQDEYEIASKAYTAENCHDATCNADVSE